MVYENNIRGGGGGSSSGMMMMMLGLVVCCCMCVSVLAGGYAVSTGILTPKGTTDTAGDTADDDDEGGGVTTAPVTTNMDGAKLLTVGGKSMNVTGSCSKGTVGFSESKNDKWLWYLKKAGDWNGIPYYTIESFYKNFSKACAARFLTAPTGCKAPPFLGKSEFGPRQYWLFVTDGTGFQLRSLACAQGRYSGSFLMQAAQKGKKRPTFSARSGSSFVVGNEYTA